MSCHYEEILPHLHANDIYPDKLCRLHMREKVTYGLSLFCPPMMINEKRKKLKSILGDGWRIDAYPNQQEIQITKKAKQ